MNDLLEVGNLSSIFETPVPNETSIEVEDDDNGPKTPASDYNSDQPSINEVQGSKKKQKKRKFDETREEVKKLIEVLEKIDDKGPSIKDYTTILQKIIPIRIPFVI